jgi:hypothetical protein
MLQPASHLHDGVIPQCMASIFLRLCSLAQLTLEMPEPPQIMRNEVEGICNHSNLAVSYVICRVEHSIEDGCGQCHQKHGNPSGHAHLCIQDLFLQEFFSYIIHRHMVKVDCH